jgi:hypothetical protein
MGSNTVEAPNNNPGMIQMAQAMEMSAMYNANASVASAGLQASTQMYQANIMYLVQHEKNTVKRDLAGAEMVLKERELQYAHAENVREQYIEFRRMLQETGQEFNSELNGDDFPFYNIAEAPNFGLGDDLHLHDSGHSETQETVLEIVQDGTSESDGTEVA